MKKKKARKDNDWPLKEKDITNAVCKSCALCCSMEWKPGGDERMMDGLRAMVEPDGVMTRGLEWIGDGVRIWCTHLKGGNGEGWECGIYNRRPQICKDFNCVSWAKVSNNKELYNEVLKKIGMT
jgi:Fe-S-cluster containining protein